jgi:hypothetical protein
MTTHLFVIFLAMLFNTPGVDLPSVVELQAKSRVQAPGNNVSLLEGALRCDRSGAVFYVPGSRKAELAQSIVRVSADGKRTRVFSMRDIPKFKDSSIYDYSVGPQGEVLLLSSRENTSYLVIFDESGDFKSVEQIDAGDVLWMHLAMFDSNLVFVGGRRNGDLKPVSAIINIRGQLVRTISLPGDVKPDRDPPKKGQSSNYDLAVDLTILEGSDGSVYLARGTRSGPVFELNAAGQVLRRIDLTPPTSKSILVDIKQSHGQIAVVHLDQKLGTMETADVNVSILDAAEGNVIRRFHHKDATLGSALACFSPDEMTFIGSDDRGEMEIVKAGPKR